VYKLNDRLIYTLKILRQTRFLPQISAFPIYQKLSKLNDRFFSSLKQSCSKSLHLCPDSGGKVFL